MNTKNMLTIIGAIMSVQGIGLFLGAEAISAEAFAALNPDPTGVAIGAIMHEVLGVVNLMVGLILLFSRGVEPAAGAKVLMGTSLGLFLTLGHGYYNLFATESKPPLPILAIMTVMMILAFITSRKAAAE